MVVLPVTCPVFIGRRDELAALHAARRALARSRGSFVLVGGEAGMGKSRLLAHFLEQTGDRRVRTLAVTECLQEVAEPLRPVRTILEKLLATGVPGPFSGEADRALGRFAPHLASERGRAAAEGPVDRTDLYAGLTAIFAAFAARRATIVVMEDVHWSDPSTLEFLAYLAGRIATARLLIVATYRTEHVDHDPALLAALGRIDREPVARRIAIEPFAAPEMRDFVLAALDGRSTLDAAATSRIVALAEGNAFYAEELLKDAMLHGDGRDPRLPVSIRGAIRQRLAALDAFELRVISSAAVLGLRFDPALLAAVLGRDVDDVLPALRRARDAALLVEDADRAGSMRFRHALTRQVVYDELLTFERRRLHSRILATLERDGAVVDGALLFALAEHADAAGDPERTARYGELAGHASFALGGLAEAIASFERALGAVTNETDRARLLHDLAFPVSYSGDPRRAVELWEEARAIHERRENFTEAARLLQLIVCERFNVGDIPDRGAAAVAFVDRHAASIARVGRDSTYVLIANVHAEFCDVDGIDAILARIESLETLQPWVMQNVFRTEIHRAAYFGRAGAWRREVGRLHALRPLHHQPATDAFNVVDALATVVLTGLSLDVGVDTGAALEQAREIVRTWGFQRFTGWLDALEAGYALERGDLALARTRLLAACADAEHASTALVARTAPFLALALGDDALIEAARTATFVERERAEIRRHPAWPYGRLLIGGYAVWLFHRGQQARAAELLGEALSDIPYPSPRYVPLVTFAVRHLGARRVPGLAAFANVERLDPEDRVGRATASLAAAACASERGAAAANDYRAAAEAYERLGLPLYAAHAYHLAGDAPAARALYLACHATAYARDDASSVRPASESPGDWPLSLREHAVAELITEGLTNGEIAQRLSVSSKTIEKYISSTFKKLGLRSRSQIAARLSDRRGPTKPL